MKKKSQIDRCLYLNFWIHDELSKIYKNTEEKIFDVPEVAKFLDVDIEINKDLIKKDLNTNKNKLMEQINNGTLPQDPDMIVKNYDFSKYNPCFFNYNCRFSECREMKHLYEYFKDYATIKNKINCNQGINDKYLKYLTYISSLYNKHKDEEGCCPWGANMCPNYFLQCDEAYDPRKLVEALESGNPTKCTEIKESAGVIKTLEAETEEDKLRNSMYIKYMTCSYIPGSHFNKKGLICQQQSKRPHINNKFLSRYSSYNPPINISTPISKNITVNGKPMNVVLISNPNASIAAEDVKKSEKVDLSKSTSGYYSGLFPEVTGNARAYYLEEEETACSKEQPVEEMSEYCRKSKRYNKIINLSNSQSANVTLKEDIENWEDIVIPDDTSFLNEILQRLPVRMGAVSLASLGAITMLFMYYKFTPLGSWLRNVMGGEKKMKHGNHGEPRKSLNYQQDHMPQISQKKRIKIAYQNS
ncbi:VIR protein [Plasmodium vivax]|uniref:VIR protein n=1 Tax=Plasmodium vivax TaxID=5855 RepID=A0A1G4ECS8_PLAVI|nr:VIR protein [Plasmodium vivax]